MPSVSLLKLSLSLAISTEQPQVHIQLSFTNFHAKMTYVIITSLLSEGKHSLLSSAHLWLAKEGHTTLEHLMWKVGSILNGPLLFDPGLI